MDEDQHRVRTRRIGRDHIEPLGRQRAIAHPARHHLGPGGAANGPIRKVQQADCTSGMGIAPHPESGGDQQDQRGHSPADPAHAFLAPDDRHGGDLAGKSEGRHAFRHGAPLAVRNWRGLAEQLARGAFQQGHVVAHFAQQDHFTGRQTAGHQQGELAAFS